jgi:two-component system response regulator MtrA
MGIGWVATRIEPHWIAAFRAADWEIKTYVPDGFLENRLSPPFDLDVIVFELRDRPSLDTCQRICHKKIAPVLVIAPDLAYAQAALEAGADDFLVVPVDPIEALLRLRRLVRTSNFVRVGNLEIDLASLKASLDGSRVRLSSFEILLLACLAKRVGQIISSAEILEEAWGWDSEPGTLAQVKNCVNRVRKKIEPDPHVPEYIISIRREGYRLRNQRQWEANRRDAGK